MGNRIHALAQQLTGKATIEECSVDEIKHIAKRFPYFAPAQFLLLQKLRQVASPEAAAQYKKAVLFYHDPLLFDYFISSDKFYTDEESLFEKVDLSSFVSETGNKISDPITLTENPVIPGRFNEEKETGEAITQTTELFNNEMPESAITELTTEMASVQNEQYSEKSILHVDQVMPETSNDPEAVHDETVNPKNSLPEFNKDTKLTGEAASELVFEPYHTVDYFASQGIKISQEELPKDKLGKQLKSFTQWLKTMKRLPSTQIAGSAETSAEKKVETMAGQSVTESEVVTEAMAEVWAKQGNKEKAMETYNKLSLLDPSKTAYFAAKIENLKHS